MWTTSDGHELTLHQSRLAPITSQLRRPELKELVRRNYQGNLKAAVVRSVGQLARNAHRTGNLRHRKSNRRYPVFTAGLNGREYEIITSPIDSTQNAIISVSAGPSFELQEITVPECPPSWKIYPSPGGICVPTYAVFQPAGNMANESVTHNAGVYILEIPQEVYTNDTLKLRRPDSDTEKRFYVGQGSSTKGREPRSKGGVNQEIYNYKNNLSRFGINPASYKLHVWETPNAKAEEKIILEKNGSKDVKTRQPWTILTNEIEFEDL